MQEELAFSMDDLRLIRDYLLADEDEVFDDTKSARLMEIAEMLDGVNQANTVVAYFKDNIDD